MVAAAVLLPALVAVGNAGESVGQGIYCFDFGSQQTPLWQGFSRVTSSTEYPFPRGFGWRWSKKLRESSTTSAFVFPDRLCADWIEGSGMFSLRAPNGEYGVWLVVREIPGVGARQFSYRVDIELKPVIRVRAEGKRLFDDYVYRHWKEEYRPGDDLWTKYIKPAYKEMTFSTRVADGRLDVYFENCPVAAMVVYPREKEEEAEQFLSGLEQKRREEFPYILEEHKIGSVPASVGEKAKLPGYLLSRSNYLDLVYPGTVPSAEDIGRALESFAAPGEYEPLAFTVYPLKEFARARVEVGDLVSEAGMRIGRENIEVRVVRYLERPTGRNSRRVRVEPFLLQREKEITLVPGLTRQFWLTIKVPDEAAAGVYRGEVGFLPEGGPPGRLAVELKVLPFRLEPLADVYQGMYHFYPYINRFYGIEAEAMEDLREHGYNLIWSAAKVKGEYQETESGERELRLDFQPLAEEMALYRKHDFPGLRTPVMVSQRALRNVYQLTNEPFGRVDNCQVKENFSEEFDRVYTEFARQVAQLARERKWPEPLFYPDGESAKEGQPGVETAGHLLSLLKGAGVKTHTSINGPACYQLLDRLDTAGVNDGMYLREELFTRLREQGVEPWLYNVGNDRFVRGFYLWRTGCRALVKEGYLLHDPDPYNDFDGRGLGWAQVRPSPEGPVPTLEWEWSREGIDDYRYIRTLESLISKAKRTENPRIQSEAEGAEELLAEIKSGLSCELLNYTAKGGRWDNDAFQAVRWKIARGICRLQSLLSGAILPFSEEETEFKPERLPWSEENCTYRMAVKVNSGFRKRQDFPVRIPLDVDRLAVWSEEKTEFFPVTVTVEEYDRKGNFLGSVPAKPLLRPGIAGELQGRSAELVFLLTGNTPVFTERFFLVYLAGRGKRPPERELEFDARYGMIIDRAADQPRNLLANADFESGTGEPSHWPAGWELYQTAASPESRCFLTDEERRSGKFSLKVITQSPEGYNGVESDFVPIKPATRYSVSFWTKAVETHGGSGVTAKLYFYNGNKKALPMQTRLQMAGGGKGKFDWTKRVFAGSSPENARFAKLKLASYRTRAVVYFDEVKVEEIREETVAPPIVKAGKPERIKVTQ